jgi:hypothetical protein
MKGKNKEEEVNKRKEGGAFLLPASDHLMARTNRIL